MSSVQNQVILKLFIGCPLTSEVRMHLNESRLWGQAVIAPLQERELLETRFQQQEYLGRFFDSDMLALDQIKAIENSLRKNIHTYCPKFNADKLIFCVFPQIFVC